MLIDGVTAILKDIKVTKKGIQVNFEGVQFEGKEIRDLASLVGGEVQLSIDIPQISMDFEDKDVNELEEPTTVEAEETTQSMSDEEVLGQLEL